MSGPPAWIVGVARDIAAESPCAKSKRGAVIYSLGRRSSEDRKILPADDPRETVAVWDRVIPLVVYSNYIPATVRDEDEEIGERASMFQHLAGYDRDTATTMGRTLVKRYRKPAPKPAPAAQQGFSFVAELNKLLGEDA